MTLKNKKRKSLKLKALLLKDPPPKIIKSLTKLTKEKERRHKLRYLMKNRKGHHTIGVTTDTKGIKRITRKFTSIL